jgi:exopolyphosphatase/guanosine-5'-triphosphate,3'-diphosphate pyrophosphatase
MSQTRRAVIDVGTNSVKLLVADIQGREVHPVCEDSIQTRLGQGFYETRRLQAAPIAKTADAVRTFAQKARELKAGSVRVIATSAARDAINPDELIFAIESAAGLRVEIISGEKEAEWAFHGVTTDHALANEPLLLLDVGGGSTEFILGQGEHKHFQESFPLGTVRLMEKVPHSDPPRREELNECRVWLARFLETEVQPKLAPRMNWKNEVHSAKTGLRLVGTGGTASILARMELQTDDFNREHIEGTRLSIERVRWQVRHLWSLPFAEREKIIGLPPKRADVILTGAVIFEAVMEQFGFPELRVSTRGLRFAAVMDGA